MELPASDAAHKDHGGGRRRRSCRLKQRQPKIARPRRRGRHGGDRPGVGRPARPPVRRRPPAQPTDRPEPVANAVGYTADARDGGHSHPAMALVCRALVSINTMIVIPMLIETMTFGFTYSRLRS